MTEHVEPERREPGLSSVGDCKTQQRRADPASALRGGNQQPKPPRFRTAVRCAEKSECSDDSAVRARDDQRLLPDRDRADHSGRARLKVKGQLRSDPASFGGNRCKQFGRFALFARPQVPDIDHAGRWMALVWAR